MIASALGSLISGITVLMFLAGSYGTAGGLTLEGLIIILGPPATFVAGIGLLFRQRWARIYLLALLFAVLAYNIYGIAKGPTSESTHTTESGVRITTLASDANYSPVVMAISAGLIVVLFMPKIRAEFVAAKVVPEETTGNVPERRWRVGHQGRDMMYYEEWNDGGWQRLVIDGEMLTGRAHHVIYFASPERWQSYPKWARLRRDEIIARIKSEFREPDYEYSG